MRLEQEIAVTELEGLRIGNAQNFQAKTGVTILIFDRGARMGIDVSGGGPASREAHLAHPLTADNPINALVLSGGSAYGLAASSGVMQYMEEHHIGFDTGFAKVPLICQACIYDLGYGDALIRPDAAMGYAACLDAEKNKPAYGNVGAGTGATVGKICGMERSTKAGLGIYAVQVGLLKMAAVVVVNALGDIYDPATGRMIAGLKTEDGRAYMDSRQEIYKLSQPTNMFTANTTIGAVVTNGCFSKAEMSKIASMTRSAFCRCINPVGTMADGDTIYAASIGDVQADINMAGVLAAEAMTQAILKAFQE